MNRRNIRESGTTAQDRPVGGQANLPGQGVSAGRGRAALKFIPGILFSASALPLFPVVVGGWLVRLMRRKVRLEWMAAGRSWTGGTGERHSRADGTDEPLLRGWPNWFVAQEEYGPAPAAHLGRRLLRPVQSFIENLRVGLPALVNMWLITLPATALWAYSWHAGWINSFHKGYEQAGVGPLTGLLGVAAFIAAMYVAPIALARQASTGQWRSFYDFRLILRIISRERLRCATLAGWYAVIGVPLTILTVLPGFFEAINPGIASWDSERLLRVTRLYYVAVSVLGFSSLVFLRLQAGRIYATGALRVYAADAASRGAFAPVERAYLEASMTGQEACTPHAGFYERFPMRQFLAVLGIAAPVATALLWFALVAQIYISQFLYYRPISGWMNHPLIQMPKFFYLPTGFGGM